MDSMSDIIEIVQKKIDKTEQVFYSNKKNICSLREGDCTYGKR